MVLRHRMRDKQTIAFETLAAFEMANLTQEETGLPGLIWVDEAAYTRDTKHSKYRVKYVNGSSSVYVTFNGNICINGSYKRTEVPERKLTDWVKQNEETLIRFYDRKPEVYSTSAFLKELKRIQ